MAATAAATTTTTTTTSAPQHHADGTQTRRVRRSSPPTPATEHRPSKFRSMYAKDFYEYPTEVVMEGLVPKGKEPDRETIRDVLFGQSPTTGFAAWRIPNRICGEVEDAKIGDHVGMVEPEKAETPRILRQATLPALQTRAPGIKPFTPRPRVVAGDAVHEVPQSTVPMRRARTTLDTPSVRPQGPRPLVANLDLKATPMATKFKSRAVQWEEKLPVVDPRLLHKVLHLHDAQQATGLQQKLRGTLLPDARRTVERWLESASESERVVALQFFRSLAGSRLMASVRPPPCTSRSDSKKWWTPCSGGITAFGIFHIRSTTPAKQMLDQLHNPMRCVKSGCMLGMFVFPQPTYPGGRWVQEAGLSPRGGIFGAKVKPLGQTAGQDCDGSSPAKPTPLKHSRLLDSKTRQNRWMQTTWYHLPQYQQPQDAVANSSSHYVCPQQMPHRHFVIHPDWPPQKK
ncbi:hypothetical protein ACOMHN_012423 [Nucella lapillus]